MFEMMLATGRFLLPSSDGYPGPVIPNPAFDIMTTGSAMVAIGDNLFIMGGVNNNGTRLRNLTSYNTLTGVWTSHATIPTAVTEVNYSKAVAIGNEIWLVNPAGVSTGVIAIYNVALGTWRTVANTSTVGINTSCGITTDGSRYIWLIGGSRSGGPGTKLFQVYDTQTNNWSRLADVTNGRNYGTAAYYKNKIYVQGAPPVDLMDYLSVYDTTTNQWLPESVSPRPRLDATVLVTVENKIVSLTGFQGQLAPTEVYVYEPDTGLTYSPGKIPKSRFFSYGCSKDNKVWYAGGNGGNPAVTENRMLDLTSYVFDPL